MALSCFKNVKKCLKSFSRFKAETQRKNSMHLVCKFYFENLERFYSIISNQYNLKEHFVTDNFYKCIEINSHSMILLMLRLKERELDFLF